ncbi:sugar kinase [Candidatus Thiomargarita nelsonii]|uniref:Sugar kinase n=1 Tax=Candidatus Thiomargarita nelsonii TaxID=1003181 RepID=A0A0A6PKB7_9GAMM|nr:sugar kinase [Candidatus Thiomargarita nelsonii]
MNKMNKIILVVRRTRLDDLIARFNTLAQAQFYVEHLGADFSDYQKEHDNYKKAVTTAEAQLRQLGRVQVLDRDFLPNFIFAEQDTIVVLGQDGLVANTLKYLNGHKIIGVNPDPQRWDGILLPFQVADLTKVIPEVFGQHRPIQEVTMAKASLNNGQILYGVNDLFIGHKSHTSALYQIEIGQQQEQQSSSGIIVSTGLGSTAWFKSLVIGATAITQALTREGKIVAVESSYPWDANYLHFTVREPFPSSHSGTELVFGKITAKEPMSLVSQMPENGVIFSDGIENDFLEFNAGTQAMISLAEKRGYLVV